MALFDWLKRLVTPARPTRSTTTKTWSTRHPSRHPVEPDRSDYPPELPPIREERPVHHAAATQPTPRVSAPKVTPTPHTQAQPNATLVVRLVDTANRPLQPALVLTGHIHDAVHFKQPNIPGYTLQTLDGFTQNFLSEYGLMTLVYERNLGQPVITYQVDYDSGQLLALPQLFRGPLAASFQLTPPSVPGYHIFQAQGDQVGQFATASKRVVYFYRRDDWQTVQRVHQYVTLLADHAVYDEPAGRTYRYQFPADSLWRLFAIITMTDGTVWYNLGGEQWLDATDTERHEHWERVLQLPPKITTWQATAYTANGFVDYVPQDAVTIFREPYGESAGQLKNGEPLDIRQRLVDDQHLVWYQVGPAAYINARYVRLAPPTT